MKKQTQHIKFASEALPILFHNQTTDFFDYLERDGIQFLKFWWDHVGDKLKENSSSEGMKYEIRTLDNGKRVVLITLPHPHSPSEAYYLAMIDRPQKRSLFSWQNLARVISLESSEGSNTRLYELTSRARRVFISEGPRPDLEPFYTSVCQLEQQKKSIFSFTR
jgi:hypothetical protein